MAEIWQILIQSNTINFLAVAVIIAILCVKLDIKKRLETISNDITSYVENSSLEKELALKELEEINDKILLLDKETEEIKQGEKRNIQSIKEGLETDRENIKNDIKNNVTRLLNLETRKFKLDLTAKLAEKSVELAQKNAQEQLKDNRELHNRYINAAINEIDRIDL